MKKIAILTSGGDCGGLNAAVRSIYYRAKNKYGMTVYGIKNGTTGLIRRPIDYIELSREIFSGYLLKQGGTFLGTTNKGTLVGSDSKNDSKKIIEAYKNTSNK